MILSGLIAIVMVNVSHAQNSTEMEKFIKKYENQGNYVEMSGTYVESLRPKLPLRRIDYEIYGMLYISPQSVLLSFKSLTASSQYLDELLAAIEKDKFERQTYSRKGESLSAQYVRQYENKTDYVMFNKTSNEVSVILMTGQDTSFNDFLGYLQVIRKHVPSHIGTVD